MSLFCCFVLFCFSIFLCAFVLETEPKGSSKLRSELSSGDAEHSDPTHSAAATPRVASEPEMIQFAVHDLYGVEMEMRAKRSIKVSKVVKAYCANSHRTSAVGVSVRAPSGERLRVDCTLWLLSSGLVC